jgi:hypothetical protein
MEICKLAAFFEGGMTYNELRDMPLDEFFKVIECANKIHQEREKEMRRSKHGK